MRRHPGPPSLRAVVFLFLAAVSSAGGANEFMVQVETHRDALASAEAAASGKDEALVQLDEALLADEPATLAIPLPDGRVLTAIRDSAVRRGLPELVWSGRLEDDPPNAAGIAPGSARFYRAEGRLFGVLQSPDGLYFELRPENGGFHRLIRFTSPPGDSCGLPHPERGSRRPPDDPGETALLAGSTQTDCAVPAELAEIDVLVLYPRSFAASPQSLYNYSLLRIADSNWAFQDSNVNVRYRLAGVERIEGAQPSPPEPGYPGGAEATGPALRWLNGQFADETQPVETEVERLRRIHAADMVVLMVDPYPGVNCGIANLPELLGGIEVLNDTDQAFARRAFAVVEYDCGNGDFTFTHELGHTIGMWHENPARLRIILPWAYGHLFTRPSTGTQVATIMGCTPGFNACSRIGQFSNPDVLFEGIPTGRPGAASSVPRPAHNACVANLRGGLVARYEPNPDQTPPLLYLESPAENEAAANVLQVVGWTMDAAGGIQLGFQIDGQPVSPSFLQERIARPEVCASYPAVGDPNCPNVGFRVNLDVQELTNTTHTFTVTARDPAGNTATVARTFQGQNSSYVHLSSIADAWVDKAAPAANFGSATRLEMQGGNTASPNRRAFLKFDLTRIPRPVTSAWLNIRTDAAYQSQRDYTYVRRAASDTWGESTITWNNAPALLAPSLPIRPEQGGQQFLYLEVTPFVESGKVITITLTTQAAHYLLSRENFPGPDLFLVY